MKAKLLLISAAALLVSSCSTIRTTADYASVDNKVVSFTVADLDVKKNKVEMTYSWSYNPFKRVSISNIKGNVTAELLKQNDADVLVEPNYIVEQRGFLRGGSVTVIGIPAKYKNFHKMTPEEAAIVRDAQARPEKKTKKWFFF